MSSDHNASSAPGSRQPAPDMAMVASHLSKVYQLYKAPSDRLKQILFGRRRKYYDEYTALDDISFELPRGEVLGLVGRNGAGKSTLLQLICGTLTPSAGELAIHGRIAALLELGAGFNPQFTGRENIYLSATVMGISQQEIENRLEGIIDFSGIRPFIDQPVTTYSSGMYVRLAFSVATSVEPDILVIDEALSVGDGDFARRSFERIMGMREAGKTILFCSHSLYQVEMLCTRAIWLEKGKVRESGPPALVIPAYQAFLDQLGRNDSTRHSAPRAALSAAKPNATIGTAIASGSATNTATGTVTEKSVGEATDTDAPSAAASLLSPVPRPDSGARLIRITATADGISGKQLHLTSRVSNLHLDIEFQSSLQNETPQVALAIHNAGGQLITSCGCWVDGISPAIDSHGSGRIQISFDRLPLLKGTYHVGVLLFCERGIFLHDEADPVVTLHVSQPNQERGVVYLPHRWHLPATDKAPVATGPDNQSLSRWRVTTADEVPQTALLALFADIFGHAIDPLIWRWKYRYAVTPGTVVLENDRPVAFSGGIPRDGLVFGKPETLVQLGDIMVARDLRGILTKKGPFYLAVQHYLSSRVGPGLAYSLAFGFPNERACKVGIKRGLYCSVDKLLEPEWLPLPVAAPQPCRAQLIEVGHSTGWQQQTDHLWAGMQQDLADVAIGCRDSQWIRYRYIDKPAADYLLYLVSADPVGGDNGGGDPIGLLVLRRHGPQGLELLDLVARRAVVPALIAVARQLTATHLAARLFAWATPAALAWFAGTEPTVNPTPVVIPGCRLNGEEHALRVKDRWWLLGGDSDFR
jgi:ABC-type polysaccharide/polyol phosphate transport system ATPase subunit